MAIPRHLGIFLLPLLLNATATADDTGITVLVYDFAGIPSEQLLAAEGETSRIFHHSQVQVTWRLCRAEDHPIPVDCPAPTSVTPALRLVKRFQVAPRRVRADAMGYATGDYATVSVEFAQRLEQSGLGQLSEILGHVMAHEIGHLLLPGDGHSASGIMRPHWAFEDWVLIRQGKLLFTPAQARILRSGLPQKIEWNPTR